MILPSGVSVLGPEDFDQAACRESDPDMFFPKEHRTSREQIAAAKAVCARCPVRDRCLRESLRWGDVEGVWGGSTAAERRAMLFKRAPHLPGRPEPAGGTVAPRGFTPLPHKGTQTLDPEGFRSEAAAGPPAAAAPGDAGLPPW
jgi:WhiB family redox-sensing transcriptional regulator